MLIINPLERKGFKFDVSISGINPEQLEGFLRFKVEDVEYGFPAEILKDKIAVAIPPLSEVVGKDLNDGEIIDGRLELVGNGFFVKSWQGEFQIQNPVTVTAQLEGESSMGEIKVTTVSEIKEKKEIVSEEPPEEADSGEIPPKELKEKECAKDKDREAVAQEKVQAKLDKVSSFVDQFLASGRKERPTKKLIKEAKAPVAKKKKTIKKQAVNPPSQMTSKQDVHLYMESVGLRSSRVQDALYERAEERTDTDDYQGIYEHVKTMLTQQGKQ